MQNATGPKEMLWTVLYFSSLLHYAVYLCNCGALAHSSSVILVQSQSIVFWTKIWYTMWGTCHAIILYLITLMLLGQVYVSPLCNSLFPGKFICLLIFTFSLVFYPEWRQNVPLIVDHNPEDHNLNYQFHESLT
jgi:hypothetical protein